MNFSFINKISADLKESRIDWRVALVFIPAAFSTYLFHEFGHWALGELTGNDMIMGLNNAQPANGYFINGSDALWSAIGGPAFTIVEAIFFFLITGLTKSVLAYCFVFFAAFSRIFSIIFGGFRLQDEAGIASLLGIYKYSVAVIVLAILITILWRCSRILKLNLKAIGYFTVLGVIAILIVLGVNGIL